MTQLQSFALKDDPDPKKEAQRLLHWTQKQPDFLSGKNKIFLLDEHGKLLSSNQWAQQMEHLFDTGASSFSFIVGGAYGLSQTIKQKYPQHISLSPLTFPHDMAQLLLFEQIYRWLHILAGTKYHHD